MSNANSDEECMTPEFQAEAASFYAMHGYPIGDGVDLQWIEQMLAASERRLMILSAMKAPPVILENERRIIAKRKKWASAWVKNHPNRKANNE